MGGKDVNYQIVYRGESLDIFKEAGWVFFQRGRDQGGGYWFGRTYNDCFMLEFENPVSLSKGLHYLLELDRVQRNGNSFDDDFWLIS